MIEIGKFNVLTVLRRASVGLYLGDEDGNEVLLPNKYVSDREVNEGDMLEVFVYRDSEDRLISVTTRPLIELNQFAYLEVKDVNEFGAFLDWGMEKDLFVPYREQMRKMEEDRSYMVYMFRDEATDRLVASAKINKFFDNANLDVKVGDEVEIVIWTVTELGVRVIVNNRYKGMIFHNEIFTHLNLGDKRKAYIRNIREDNQLDVVLEKPGYEAVEPNAAKILERLKECGGFLSLTDKSDPIHIYQQLEMSKKLFKKAIGALYKQKLILLEEEGIRLVD